MPVKRVPALLLELSAVRDFLKHVGDAESVFANFQFNGARIHARIAHDCMMQIMRAREAEILSEINQCDGATNLPLLTQEFWRH